MSGGAAAGDFDRDGHVDLLGTRIDAPDFLYRNRGDGTFVSVSAEPGFTQSLKSNGAAWGDIDNNGKLDLYVTTLEDIHNDAHGRFEEQAIGRRAALLSDEQHFGCSPAFGDFDVEGYLDLYTAKWRNRNVNLSV